jgi:hypothetical protein
MENTEHFVSTLRMAMGDEGFRAELMKDMEGALEKRGLHGTFNAGEINELKGIFQAGNDPAQVFEAHAMACSYRGYDK